MHYPMISTDQLTPTPDNARPTKPLAFYVRMIGRGTKPLPTIVDQGKKAKKAAESKAKQ